MMKISEEVLKDKGIAYVKKYPYADLSKTAKNGKDIIRHQTEGQCLV